MAKNPFKKGAPYISKALTTVQNLYNTGQEGEFLNCPRTAPERFRDLSSFPTQESVVKTLSSPLILSHPTVKAVDRNVKAALSAASYAGHFLDGAQIMLSSLQEKVDALATPPLSSPYSSEPVDAQRREMQGLVQPLATFIERAKHASFDSVGSLVDVDVNLTLVTRDKLTSKISTYLTQHVPTLRNASCMSKEVLPGVADVALLATADATHQVARLAAITVAAKARAPYPPKAGKADRGARRAQTVAQPPFQGRGPQRPAKGAAPAPSPWTQPKRGRARGKGRGRGRGRGQPNQDQ
jgi:hypothetical protein